MPSTFPYTLVLFLTNGNFFSISVIATVGVHKCYEWVNLATFTRLKSVFAKDNVRENVLPWWKYFSEFPKNYLRFSHFSIFWEILEDFSDFFRNFSIVSGNYRIRNLTFKEKRRKFRFLKNSKKSLPFSSDISYSLRTRWDWETKNSRKIAETLDLKNSVKNLIFSVKNFYFIRIQQSWEHDNFEKIWETSHLENSLKNLILPE